MVFAVKAHPLGPGGEFLFIHVRTIMRSACAAICSLESKCRPFLERPFANKLPCGDIPLSELPSAR